MRGNDKNQSEIQEQRRNNILSAADDIIVNEDVSQMLKDAKEAYKKAYKSGEISGKETVELEDE